MSKARGDGRAEATLLKHLTLADVACKNYEVLNKILSSNNIPFKEHIVIVNPKKYCFIHSCTLSNTGTKKLDYIIDLINSSGLIHILDKVFINNIGIPIDDSYISKYNSKYDSKYDSKYNISNYSRTDKTDERIQCSPPRRKRTLSYDFPP